MKNKFHILGAGLGLACAAAFSMVPFTATADAGPRKVTAVSAPKTTIVKENVAKKKMTRHGVKSRDDGCEE